MRTLTLHYKNNAVSNLLTQAAIEHSLIGGIAIGLRTTVDMDYLANTKDVALARQLPEENEFTYQVETDAKKCD